MEYDKWEPIYKKIVEDFGFSEDADADAAQLLSNLLIEPVKADLNDLTDVIKDKDTLICGNAPTLKKDLEQVDPSDHVIIAADGATSVLLEQGLIPDVIVTDLDGDVEKEIEANKKGAIMVVHAHGDNTGKILSFVPLLTNIIGTSQTKPPQGLFNFGGFTDGDRCVFMAHQLGATSMTLVGFDFDDDNVDEIKKKKLNWARRLIEGFA
ncbi:6-hydroxymethylpterin diphosphokinase MptE-like protein [Methanohalophilus profundi]|uniref:6-hydroxymethylpterin diphosphokinase MptE-like protein n=1 Tax=Methanohalophilus profundi TaxID=2138083 RepID=UPI00101D6EDA|nr:6-hydroxymethylpterin diphosphokinase MptE-like protein [Methanohalophilus profundi]